MGHLSSMVSTKRFRYNASQPGVILSQQIRNKAKIEGLKKQIFEFLCDDENSTQSPNKNDVLSLKKQKQLKRYLNDTLQNLKNKFVKSKGKNISLNTFLKHKPFFVVYMKCDARDTCACPDHLNMQLKIDKLREWKIIESKNLSAMMADQTCEGKRMENCMLGWCDKCKNKKLKTLDYDAKIEAFYYKWNRVEEKRINKDGQKYTFKAMANKKFPRL